jgi:zinc protease
MEQKVKVLYFDNGMTVVFFKKKQSGRVSFQMLYSVGAKSENNKNAGISHMIEHMFFKGTKKLKEGVLDAIVYKISGVANAFTSYDYTGYVFNVPSCNCEKIFFILSDSMNNCLFRDEYLRTEIKTVFQELKMYSDDTLASMASEIMSGMFYDHPYRRPIVGYKNTIVSFTTEDLTSFYKKFYTPQNSVLAVVGDISKKDVVGYIERYFKTSRIRAFSRAREFPRKCDFHEADIRKRRTILYRDVEIPHFLFAWEIPGVSKQNIFMYGAISYLLGGGRGSILYRKLVYEMDIANSIEVFIYDLFDYSVLFVYVQPKLLSWEKKIYNAICEVFRMMEEFKLDNDEFVRAINRTKMFHVNFCENSDNLAYFWSKFVLAFGSLDGYVCVNSITADSVQAFCGELAKNYLLNERCEYSIVKKLRDSRRPLWISIQNEKDKSDRKLFSKIKKRTIFEKLDKRELNFSVKRSKNISLPSFDKHQFENGLTMYTSYLNTFNKVEILIDFKAKYFTDPLSSSGRMKFLFELMEDGSKNYSGNKFSESVEIEGIIFNVSPGMVAISCLPEKIEKAIIFLYEYLLVPEMKLDSFCKLKRKIVAEIYHLYDSASYVAGEISRKSVYRGHPYGRSFLGSASGIKSLSLCGLNAAYGSFITPFGAIVAICGAVDMDLVVDLWNKYLGSWRGDFISDGLLDHPKPVRRKLIHHEMNREQSVIAVSGLSLSRTDDRYNDISIFDQYFSGGVLSSMSSRLFLLREHTGMFYSISGTLLSGCSRHEGMVYLTAMTSPGKVEAALNLLDDLFDSSFDDFNEDDFVNAKNALLNSFASSFFNYKNIVSAIIFMHKFGLSSKYFEDRILSIENTTINNVKDSARSVLDKEKIIQVVVGRKL